MRRSNCSAPIPTPRGSPGVRGKTRLIKKGGAIRKKGETSDYIGRDKGKIKR